MILSISKQSHLKRVTIARALLGVVISTFCCTWAFAAERNIVLIVADDHGCDAGCYGNRVIQTPSIDALASEGTVFTKAFCTTASCSASRSVILTGMHNHANGQYGHEHDYHKFSTWANAGSLPRYLEKAGYRTARCGKFHVAPESVYHFQQVLPGGGRNDMEMADHCADFVSQESEKPFFLYLCFNDPHRGRGVNRNLPHQPNRFGNEAASAANPTVTYTPDDVVVPEFLPDTAACREELAEYYQSVSRLDAAVGRLVEHLKSAGVYDKTLIVYLSDHGVAMPGAKTTVYEGGMHSPLVVRNPYADAHKPECDAMISWVDITPTLLDFAGVFDTNANSVKQPILREMKQEAQQAESFKKPYAAAGTFHGRSFLPYWKNDSFDGWDEVYASHTFHEITMYYPMRVVRERKYKLIWNIASDLPFPFASDLWAAPTWQYQYQLGPQANYGSWTVDRYVHRPKFELFDLESDPHETRNLADDPVHAETLARLQQKLKTFQRETNDPWLLKWQYE
ncbi:sulfatase family protein [Aeoliella mucimassa]|uniref:Arylsulfatase n=1 Tax=Aeoliella mucimassa TaxID=2527972 RepID=A0A518AMX5_9BACT|nr:sulfatase [Aeoliella mucimassa]QDU56041.1 Arylsulfatase [Aeoliella mucimassa]